ncbi:pyruvate ferredoxin/flavodoxin oxidoreductase family domain protein [Mycobacterium intracellulare]|nr:pyruvate ferredoxin/flavodoxin oxidoreductase family domain protein [Mycobacterium intracellulare]
MYFGLAAEFCLYGSDGQTIRLDATVAAAFADALVDNDALIRC